MVVSPGTTAADHCPTGELPEDVIPFLITTSSRLAALAAILSTSVSNGERRPISLPRVCQSPVNWLITPHLQAKAVVPSMPTPLVAWLTMPSGSNVACAA